VSFNAETRRWIWRQVTDPIEDRSLVSVDEIEERDEDGDGGDGVAELPGWEEQQTHARHQ
jgi:hypothetical protein